MVRMGKGFWVLAKRTTMMVEKLIFGAGGSKVRRGRPREYENWEVILALMVKDRKRLPYFLPLFFTSFAYISPTPIQN
jgi:hypothetical protein